RDADGIGRLRNVRITLRRNLGRLARALFVQFERDSQTWIWRALPAYVGFLSRLVRRSVSRAIHKCRAVADREMRRAENTLWRFFSSKGSCGYFCLKFTSIGAIPLAYLSREGATMLV